MQVTSTGKGEDYAWLSRYPKMRKWLGDKHLKGLAAKTYYIKNEDWEVTISVDRNDIEDDQLGIYASQVQMAGLSAAELYGDIINEVKNNAFTGIGMDDTTFYSTSHTLNDSNGTTRTYSNKGTVALSAADTASVTASYGAARVAIMKMADEEGQNLGLMPDLLEVPPALEAVARTIADSDKLADLSVNPYRGTCKVYVNPGLTSDTAWFLHVTSRPIKPFIVQVRKAPTLVSQVDTSSDAVFLKREFRYGAEARAAGAYGFWQLSYGSTGV
jgi:phage major head subunit gpT-like protein